MRPIYRPRSFGSFDRQNMISFTCDKCGKAFKLPDQYAGKTARCKVCGNALTVPEVKVLAESIATIPAPSKIPMRTRRMAQTPRRW